MDTNIRPFYEEASFIRMRESLTDLYSYFRMDSSADPTDLFEQLCFVLTPLVRMPERERSGLFGRLEHESMNLYSTLLRRFKEDENNDPSFSPFPVKIQFRDWPELVHRLLHTAFELADTAHNDSALFRALMADFLETMAQSRHADLLYTPLDIAREVVRLMLTEDGAQPLRRLLDPALGSGAFWVAFVEQTELGNLPKQTQAPPNFTGIERDERLCRCVALLCNVDEPKKSFLKIEESGLFPYIDRQTYDLILANPPFLSVSRRNREMVGDWEVLPVETNDLHRAFIQKILLGLRPGGRCAVIVPDSFLNTSAGDAVQVRRWLLENYCCEGVIKLSYRAFYPQSAVSASIMILRNPKYQAELHQENRAVFFFNVEQDEKSDDAKRRPSCRDGFERLHQVWPRRESYYREWEAAPYIENAHGVTVPAYWEHTHFWFGRLEDIRRQNYILLPQQYRTSTVYDETIQNPEKLLEDLQELGTDILSLIQQIKEAEYVHWNLESGDAE